MTEGNCLKEDGGTSRLGQQLGSTNGTFVDRRLNYSDARERTRVAKTKQFSSARKALVRTLVALGAVKFRPEKKGSGRELFLRHACEAHRKVSNQPAICGVCFQRMLGQTDVQPRGFARQTGELNCRNVYHRPRTTCPKQGAKCARRDLANSAAMGSPRRTARSTIPNG